MRSLLMIVLFICHPSKDEHQSGGRDLFRQRSCAGLSPKRFQLLFYLFAAHLRVADRGLNGWCP